MAQQREQSEPWERNRPVPWLVLVVIVGLFIWSVGYIWFKYHDLPPAYGDMRTAADFQVASASTEDGGSIDGSKVYATHCVACHQATGAGVPGVFPPLGGSEWVEGEASVFLQIVLHGVRGELSVAGTVYSGEMPSFGDKLNDSELAALASYVRSEFNQIEQPVTAAEVAAQRQAIDRSDPWQGSELQELLK